MTPLRVHGPENREYDVDRAVPVINPVGLDQDLEGTREPTGLGLNIDFESLYLAHSFGSTECI